MVDDHGIAIEIVVPGCGHNAVARSTDEVTATRRDIHALVWCARLIIEETARAEARTVWSGYRRAQADVVECHRAPICQCCIDDLALPPNTREIVLTERDEAWVNLEALLAIRMFINTERQRRTVSQTDCCGADRCVQRYADNRPPAAVAMHDKHAFTVIFDDRRQPFGSAEINQCNATGPGRLIRGCGRGNQAE